MATKLPHERVGTRLTVDNHVEAESTSAVMPTFVATSGFSEGVLLYMKLLLTYSVRR